MKYQFECDEIGYCGSCPFMKRGWTINEYYCGRANKTVELNSKPKWCPLVEVQDDK